MYEGLETSVCSVGEISSKIFYNMITPTTGLKSLYFYIGHEWADKRTTGWSTLGMLYANNIIIDDKTKRN